MVSIIDSSLFFVQCMMHDCPTTYQQEKGSFDNSQRKTGSTLILSKSMPDLCSPQLIVVWVFAV